MLDLQGVQNSRLAEAFGPEDEEPQGNEGAPGRADRVQIGDALVALLESHRKHRSLPMQPAALHRSWDKEQSTVQYMCSGQSFCCPLVS